MNKLKTLQQWIKLKPKWVKTALLILALFLLLENIALSFDNLQNKTTTLGLRLDNKSVSGLDRHQLQEIVKKEVESNRKPVQFIYNGRIFEIKQLDIGAKVDVGQFTNQLIEEGRKGNILDKLISQNQSILGLKNIKLKGQISQALLNIKILEIQNEVNIDPKPIMPDFESDIQKTLPAQDGIKLDTNKLTILISDHIFSPPKDPIILPMVKAYPVSHKEEELIPIKKQAEGLIKQPLAISSGGLTFTLTVKDLRSHLAVVDRPDPKDPKKIMLVLRLDDKALNQKLGEFAQKVEDITHAEFDDHDARVAIYSQFYLGKRKAIAIPTGRSLEGKNVLGEQTGGEKAVYLTFDDGPNSIYHPMILDILKTYNVSATFFMVGQNVQRDQLATQRTKAEGHKIGNHSLTHSFLPNFSSASILKELKTTDDILKPINSNTDIKLFRPPYGGVNLYVKKNAENLGLKLYLWDIDPRDWSEPPTDELVRRVVSATFNGADILLHSNHMSTVKALPKIIEALRNQGYIFKTLE